MLRDTRSVSNNQLLGSDSFQGCQRPQGSLRHPVPEQRGRPPQVWGHDRGVHPEHHRALRQHIPSAGAVLHPADLVPLKTHETYDRSGFAIKFVGFSSWEKSNLTKLALLSPHPAVPCSIPLTASKKIESKNLISLRNSCSTNVW